MLTTSSTGPAYAVRVPRPRPLGARSSARSPPAARTVTRASGSVMCATRLYAIEYPYTQRAARHGADPRARQPPRPQWAAEPHTMVYAITHKATVYDASQATDRPRRALPCKFVVAIYANTPPYTPIYTAVYANKTPIGNRRIRIDATRVGVSLSESPVPVSRCVRPTGEWRPSGAPAARARGAPLHYNDNRGLPACSSSPLSCIAHSLAYSPLSASNSACVPRSTTVPSRTTRMQSASTTVESRWAIMMHV